MAREDSHSTSNPEHENQSTRGAERHEQREPHERRQEHDGVESAEHPGMEGSGRPTAARAGGGGLGRPLLTTAAVIGVAAFFQPELLAGMAIGAGVALSSSLLPNLVGGTLRPIVKTALKAGYTAASLAREMASEASESMQDIMAEARMERGSTE
jgi:Protein of unknown function (DUF5132)